MLVPSRSRVYVFLLLSWLSVFAFEAVGIERTATRLSAAAEGLEKRAHRLESAALQLLALDRQIEAQSHELEFLKDVPNLLPQNKGYLRTQRAIADEVSRLRWRLGRLMKRGKYILVDAKVNKLYLKDGFKILWSADCSVGKGGGLVDRRSGRRWEFITPRGRFRVIGKIKDPVWRKPDWAYVEGGERRIPPPDDPSRFVKGELGAFALNLGDGYLIHGTLDPAALGRPASHGCVRLGADDLRKLYESVPEGTPVFIF